MPAHKEANKFINKHRILNNKLFARNYWRYLMGYIEIEPKENGVKNPKIIKETLQELANR